MSLDGCVSLKCPGVWPTWLLPFFSLLLLFYHCFLSLSVLLNSRTQMSSLFSPPPLSLFLRSLCLCSALCFMSLVCLFLCFCNPQLSVLFMFSRAETRAGAPCLCVQACSMHLHTSFDDCRSTSFLQFLCLDGPGEMIQYRGPHGSASSDVINYTSEHIWQP